MKTDLRFKGRPSIPALAPIPMGKIFAAILDPRASAGVSAARILDAQVQYSTGIAATKTGEVWATKFSGTPTGAELLFRLIGREAHHHRGDVASAAEKIGRDLMTSKEERDRLASIVEGKTHVKLYSRDQDKAKRWFADQTETYAKNISPLYYKLHTVALLAPALIAAKLIQPGRFEIIVAPAALKNADAKTEAF